MTALAVAVVALVAPAPCGPACEHRVHIRHWQQTWQDAPARMRRHLRSIAFCESGNDETAVQAGGQHRGLLQFDMPTWRSVGGMIDPARASRFEQWARGVRLYRLRGPAPWACA